jgi:hypothetical protein
MSGGRNQPFCKDKASVPFTTDHLEAFSSTTRQGNASTRRYRCFQGSLWPWQRASDFYGDRVRGKTLERQVVANLSQIEIDRYTVALDALIKFADLTFFFQHKSNMKVRWIDWRGRVVQIAQAEVKSAFVFQDGNCACSFESAAQAKVRFKELAGGRDVGDLEIDVIENHIFIILWTVKGT